MKKLLVVLLLLAGAASAVFSQDLDRFFNNERVQRELNLTDQEKKQLIDTWDSADRVIQVARADLDVKTAEIKRLLMEEKVDTAKVEKNLREAMEIELRIRLAQINRMIKAKEILGSGRWATLEGYLRSQMGRRFEEMHRGGPSTDGQRDERNLPPQRGMMPNRQ